MHCPSGKCADMQKSTPTSAVLTGLMTAHGFSQAKLSRATGVDQSTISRICGGKIKEPTDSQLRPLAEFFKITVDQLRGFVPLDPEALISKREIEGVQVAKPAQQEAEFLGHIEPWDSKTPLHDDEVELPFFREVELAAGNGMTEVIENHGAKLRFSKATLRRVGAQEGYAACVSVIGNSMEPMLPHGCTVGIDTLKTQITDGKIYAIDHGGMLRVKLLYRLPGGGIRIKSLNTDEYPDEPLTAEEAKSVKVLGKVFWYSGLLD